MQKHEAEEQAIAEAMLARFVESWNRADGVTYGEGYWEDAELVDPTGVIHSGRAAIVRTHVDLWAGIFQGSHNSGIVRKIRRLGPEYLLVDLDLSLTRIQQLPPGGQADASGALRAHLKHILERRDGVWKIVLAQNTFAQ